MMPEEPRKVFDISGPNTKAPSATSRPIINPEAAGNDPMVTKVAPPPAAPLDPALAAAVNAIEASEEGKIPAAPATLPQPQTSTLAPVAAPAVPETPAAPTSDLNNIPKFGALQHVIDAHPLFSGKKDVPAKTGKAGWIKKTFLPLGTLLVLIAVLFILIDSGVVRGASHLPFHVFKQPVVATAPVITPATTTPASTVDPYARWLTFSDDSLGYKFRYPNEYAAFTKKVDSPNLLNYSVSTTPTTPLITHVTGAITVSNYKTPSAEISSYKYGPTIVLANGVWTVKTTNTADPSKYKTGDTFNDITSSTANNLTTYTLKSSNEGGLIYEIVFLAKGTLHTVTLPEFDTGQGLGAGASSKANDQTAYDNFYKQVRDSIILTN